MEQEEDVLLSEGGLIELPFDAPEIRYLPRGVEPYLSAELRRALLLHNDRVMTACVLSSLLTASQDGLAPTGSVLGAAVCGQHLEHLLDLSFDGASARLDGSPRTQEWRSRFASRWGSATD